VVYTKTLTPEEVVSTIIEAAKTNSPITLSDNDIISVTMMEDGSAEIYIIPELDQH